MTKGIPAREIENALRKSDNPAALEAFRAKVGTDAPQAPKPAKPTIHIEVTKKDANGNGVSICADLADQLALNEFTRMYRGYMPRKKFLGVL